MQQASFEL